MFRRKTILYCLLAAIPFTFNRAASAQAVANAQIRGIVQDSAGAAAMGTKVKAMRVSAGCTQTAVGGSSGGYVLLNVPVGPPQ
jgi:hypothetical protein